MQQAHFVLERLEPRRSRQLRHLHADRLPATNPNVRGILRQLGMGGAGGSSHRWQHVSVVGRIGPASADYEVHLRAPGGGHGPPRQGLLGRRLLGLFVRRVSGQRDLVLARRLERPVQSHAVGSLHGVHVHAAQANLFLGRPQPLRIHPAGPDVVVFVPCPVFVQQSRRLDLIRPRDLVLRGQPVVQGQDGDHARPGKVRRPVVQRPAFGLELPSRGKGPPGRLHDRRRRQLLSPVSAAQIRTKFGQIALRQLGADGRQRDHGFRA